MSKNDKDVSADPTNNQETAGKDEAAAKPAETAEEGSPKTKKKKGVGFKVLIVVIIVVVVLAGGGGAAYGIFHPNPHFCNFICHTPMDPYVNSYLNNVSVNPQETDLTSPLCVVVHKDSDENVICLDCHRDGLSTQISEGVSWVTGNYEFPLTPFKLTYKDPKAGTNDKNGPEFCLQPGCHTGINSIDDLKAANINVSTSSTVRNPHDNHNGNMDCSTCHKMHEQSTLYCAQAGCHTDIQLPAGWISWDQYQAQQKAATS